MSEEFRKPVTDYIPEFDGKAKRGQIHVMILEWDDQWYVHTVPETYKLSRQYLTDLCAPLDCYEVYDDAMAEAERLRKKNGKNAKIFNVDIKDFPFEDTYYDFFPDIKYFAPETGKAKEPVKED